MNSAKPISQVLLKVAKSLCDEITTDSGVKLYLDPTYNKSQNVAVTATIAALPLKVNPKEKYIYDQLKVGDEVAVSYQIVADLEFKGDGERFMQATEDNPHFKEFVNGKGEWIRCYALPNHKGILKIQWVGVYQNKQRDVISGVQGTESELERWMSQFEFGKTDIYSFNNYFEYDGKDYWKADLSQIFAKKVDGHLVSVGNRVIMKPIEEAIPKEIANQLIKTTTDVKIRYQDRGRVITGGKEKGIKKEEIVSFKPNHLERYEFWGKQYYLINQNLIHGKWHVQ